MKIKKEYIIFGGVAIIGLLLAKQWKNNELLRLIDENKSIMGLWPHPDDECFTPGVFPLASSRGCRCWVVTLISLDSPPYSEDPEMRAARIRAINWFEENYLEEYINLNMLRVQPPGSYWHGWTWSFEEIKEAYKTQIEMKQPDILLTFTPHGFNGGLEHIKIHEIIHDIWDELTYEPYVFWFVNADQGPVAEKNLEYQKHPPSAVLNLDQYSEKLGKTYWETKTEFWWKYAPSLGVLNTWLNTPGNLEKNNRKEYYARYR